MAPPDNDKGLHINYTFFIIYMVLLSAFGSFVNDMYVPSLPSMARFFGCSVPVVQMGLTMGMIGLGLGQPIIGPVSDRVGRKPVLIGSGILFIIAATVSVFSPTIHFFLICRLFQGAGASGGYFLARTIPADIYHGRPLAKTMAVIGAINGFAPASAPVIGGVIADHFQWKGVFWALTIFAVILLLVSVKLKETLPAKYREHGPLREVWVDYKKLLVNRPFMIHVIFKGAALGLLFAYVSSAPFIMQVKYGWSQTAFGIIMGCNSIPACIGSMVSLRFKPLKKAGVIGAAILFVSVLAEAAVLWRVDSFWAYELLLLPMVFGLGMIFTVGNTLAMNEGRDNAGSASAILGLGGYVFGAIVAPLVGIGDITHSTALVFLATTLIVAVFAVFVRRTPADLVQKAPSK